MPGGLRNLQAFFLQGNQNLISLTWLISGNRCEDYLEKAAITCFASMTLVIPILEDL